LQGYAFQSVIPSPSGKCRVTPVMIAVETVLGRIPLGHSASAEYDAPILDVFGQLGSGESIYDGHHAPGATRWAENLLRSPRT
jgi:hypothetical protein